MNIPGRSAGGALTDYMIFQNSGMDGFCPFPSGTPFTPSADAES